MSISSGEWSKRAETEGSDIDISNSPVIPYATAAPELLPCLREGDSLPHRVLMQFYGKLFKAFIMNIFQLRALYNAGHI
jgi:hypothetical protein